MKNKKKKKTSEPCLNKVHTHTDIERESQSSPRGYVQIRKEKEKKSNDFRVSLNDQQKNVGEYIYTKKKKQHLFSYTIYLKLPVISGFFFFFYYSFSGGDYIYIRWTCTHKDLLKEKKKRKKKGKRVRHPARKRGVQTIIFLSLWDLIILYFFILFLFFSIFSNFFLFRFFVVVFIFLIDFTLDC